MTSSTHLSPHFTLEELCKSQIALRHGIDNETEDVDTITRLEALCQNVLEPVREDCKIPIIPGSGFRCLELNRLLKSDDDSQHVQGEAVDFEVFGFTNLNVAHFIKSHLHFDQLILEYYTEGVPNSGWVHCSYATAEENRYEVLRFDGKTFKKGLLDR